MTRESYHIRARCASPNLIIGRWHYIYAEAIIYTYA